MSSALFVTIDAYGIDFFVKVWYNSGVACCCRPQVCASPRFCADAVLTNSQKCLCKHTVLLRGIIAALPAVAGSGLRIAALLRARLVRKPI